MGLLEGFKNKYYLYTDEGKRAFCVLPLNKDKNNVASYHTHYEFFNKTLTDIEVAAFKKERNLFRDYELLGGPIDD